MARERIPTRIKLTTLDLSKFEGEALEYLRAHAKTDVDLGKQDVKMPEAVRFTEAWGAVETVRGLYALCTEGVGPDHALTDERQLSIDVFVDRYEGDGDQRFISMFPACVLKLKPEQVREAMTGPEVALADFIRSFGARLESNYEQWRMLLEEADKDNQDDIDRSIAEHEQAIFENPDPAYGP